MERYFIEVSYKGTKYSGFQIQENAVTIQSELEKALQIFYKEKIDLTGSSRTDTGVHALQNYFHCDTALQLLQEHIYNINAILPEDIVLKNIQKVKPSAHCRFDAISRSYQYFIYQQKNPFLADRAWYYPFPLDMDLLNQSAEMLMQYEDFTSFSKKNTQVKTFNCTIEKSFWGKNNEGMIYHVTANRFLRGMVKGLTSTMLKVGRGQISLDEFENIILSKDCTQADFTAPPHGLFLIRVHYPSIVFE
jgi:tRNA pseudouridine38-40 synthase